MARVIPWNLPSVAGGSIGGYTPAPTPPEPEDEVYLKFKDTVIFARTSDNLRGATCGVDIGAGATGVKTFNSFYGYFDGLEIVNLVGVSSIGLKVEAKGYTSNAEPTDPTYYIMGDLTAILDIDPVTLGISSFVSGSIDVDTNTMTSSVISVRTVNSDSLTDAPFFDKLTLYVYNGNGEVIQTAVYPAEE